MAAQEQQGQSQDSKAAQLTIFSGFVSYEQLEQKLLGSKKGPWWLQKPVEGPHPVRMRGPGTCCSCTGLLHVELLSGPPLPCTIPLQLPLPTPMSVSCPMMQFKQRLGGLRTLLSLSSPFPPPLSSCADQMQSPAGWCC